MALFNYATKEITLKIVYYGPGLSGKTTNIQYLHSALRAENKGKLLSLSTESDRTLFFDFLPIELGKIKEFSVRFQLYTVPGQVRYNATRKVVLKGADAVVFVADSQRDMREQNIESFENMLENLTSNNINPDEISLVLQYNKRDLTNIMTIDELNSDINRNNVNVMEAEAITGKGVEETFRLITRLVLMEIARKHKIEVQPVPVKEEVKIEEGVREVQEPESGPLELASQDELFEPSGYALEEELEEIAEPEEVMEAMPTDEKFGSEKAPDLTTSYPVEKEGFKPEPIDIWEARTPEVSMETVPAPVEQIELEKGPDLTTSYPVEKEGFKPEPIDIWEARTPEVSMEPMSTVKEVESEKGPALKAGYGGVRDVYLQEALGIREAKGTPEGPMEAMPPVAQVEPEKKPDLKRDYPSGRKFYTRETPAVSDESLKINAADITELRASISDLKTAVASLSRDMQDIKDSLLKSGERPGTGEDKNINEMRKEQREMRSILRDIAAAISDLKVKKSWFRF